MGHLSPEQQMNEYAVSPGQIAGPRQWFPQPSQTVRRPTDLCTDLHGWDLARRTGGSKLNSFTMRTDGAVWRTNSQKYRPSTACSQHHTAAASIGERGIDDWFVFVCECLPLFRCNKIKGDSAQYLRSHENMHYLSHKDLMNYETLTHLSFSQHFIQSKLQYTYYGDTPKL